MEIELSVGLAEGEEAGEQTPWVVLLGEELDEMDGVRLASGDQNGLAGAKGFALGTLLARVPVDAMRKLVEVVHAFAVRTGRTVEASIDGDSIKITGVSRVQQDRVIEAWLARHPAGS